MPKSAYKRRKTSTGYMHFRNGKLISKAAYNRGVGRKTSTGGRKMAKRKTSSRRRGGSMYSNSKANIATGALLASAAPRFAGASMPYVALLGLLPKMPAAVKIMSTTWAAKEIGNRYLGGNS